MNSSTSLFRQNESLALSEGDAEIFSEWNESFTRQKEILSGETHSEPDLLDSSRLETAEYRIFREVEERLVRRCADLEERLRRNTPTERERALQDKIRLLEGTLRASQEECAVLQKIHDADQLLSSLKKESERSAEDALVLREKKLDSRSNELDEQAAKITEQSERLRRYAEILNEEKEWIRTTSKTLEAEARSTSAFHPLRDYLVLTEKEATRVEIELKRMPANAPGRVELEECFVQLIEQREFLKNVLETSEREIESRANSFAKIHSDIRSTPVPPLPVAKSSSSKA